MAATDPHRLSGKENPLESDLPEVEAVIPARALAELSRIAQSGDTVELGVHENQVVFAADDVWLTTRRIDGQFPNYKQLLPETFEHELTLPRNELLDVVRRVGVMVQRTSPRRRSRCRFSSRVTRWRSASTRSSFAKGSSRSPPRTSG